jgi:hypothetical protein
MPHSFDQFQAKRDSALQDAAGKLAAADRDAMLVQAILQRYSKDRPRVMVTDVVSTGVSDLPLPTGDVAKFEDGFSEVMQMEYPVGDVPENIVLPENWYMYRSPSGLTVRLLSETPPSGDSVRLTWSARHADDGTTVPDQDFDAVCDYAAALGFEALAAVYAQTGDASISADTVNYRTKGQEYLALAKAARKRYFDHVGIPESGSSGAAQVGPAIAIGSQREEIGLAGIDRLTHPKSTR